MNESRLDWRPDMNDAQRLWWQQARSDYELFERLRGRGEAVCHLLHYLQMSTEKLSKAYLWRRNTPPPTVHTGFTNFMKFLGQTSREHRERVAAVFAIRSFSSFESHLKSISPLAYQLQNIHPRSQYDGPNPEYPWPHAIPTEAPVDYHFALWDELKKPKGRELMTFIRNATTGFPKYADC